MRGEAVRGEAVRGEAGRGEAGQPCAPAGRVPAVGRSPHPALYRYSVFVIVAVLLLIKVGAMVTSTNSGLAFLDWPTGNGSWWPKEMREWSPGLFEHGHRTIGALIGILTLAQVAWTLCVERRRWLRWTAVVLLILVVVQGLLGKETVQGRLPWWVSASHGTLAQVFLCGLTFFAFALSPAWARRDPVPAADMRAARVLSGVALGSVFVQLALGAIVRHANLTGVLWLHVSMAMLVSLLILVAALHSGARFAALPGFKALARAQLWVLLAQLTLGVATLVVRGGGKDTASLDQIGRASIVTSHVVTGAVLFLVATLLFVRTRRNLVAAQ